LDDLHRRVSLLEDALAAPPRDGAEKGRSPKEVKSLLRGTEVRKHERPRPQQRIEDDRKEIKRVEVRREDAKGTAIKIRLMAAAARAGVEAAEDRGAVCPRWVRVVSRSWVGCCWRGWDWRSWRRRCTCFCPRAAGCGRRSRRP